MLSLHLVVDFKLLNHSELQEHPQRRGDHGIIVQGEVVKVKLLDAQLTAQGDFSCLKERERTVPPITEALKSKHQRPSQPGLNMHRVPKHIRKEVCVLKCYLESVNFHFGAGCMVGQHLKGSYSHTKMFLFSQNHSIISTLKTGSFPLIAISIHYQISQRSTVQQCSASDGSRADWHTYLS